MRRWKSNTGIPAAPAAPGAAGISRQGVKGEWEPRAAPKPPKFPSVTRRSSSTAPLVTYPYGQSEARLHNVSRNYMALSSTQSKSPRISVKASWAPDAPFHLNLCISPSWGLRPNQADLTEKLCPCCVCVILLILSENEAPPCRWQLLFSGWEIMDEKKTETMGFNQCFHPGGSLQCSSTSRTSDDEK